MNIKLLGATAIAATMLAGSAMAQAVVTNPGRCAAQFPNASSDKPAVRRKVSG
jgi:hypothetical protein